MAICRKNDVLRDIYSMVRKGAVQFEPGDRIPVEIQTKRSSDTPVTYYIGGVSWDYYSGKLSYTLFDAKSNYIPAAGGFRDFALLKTSEIVRVREAVSSYFGRSLCRMNNLSKLFTLVEQGKEYFFSENDKPDVYLDIRMDGFCEKCSVDKLYRHGDILKVCVSDFSGKQLDINASQLTDMGLSNVLSCAKGYISQDSGIESYKEQKTNIKMNKFNI